MQKLVRLGVTAAAVAAVLALTGGTAMADSGPGGGSGSGSGGTGQSGGGSGGPGGGGGGGGGAQGVWPASYPLPNPGTITTQSSTSAVVQSPDSVQSVLLQLDDVYVNQLGCTEQQSSTAALDFLCVNPSTGRTDEVTFNFNDFIDQPSPVKSVTNASLIPG